jgi:hypothetical protein
MDTVKKPTPPHPSASPNASGPNVNPPPLPSGWYVYSLFLIQCNFYLFLVLQKNLNSYFTVADESCDFLIIGFRSGIQTVSSTIMCKHRPVSHSGRSLNFLHQHLLIQTSLTPIRLPPQILTANRAPMHPPHNHSILTTQLPTTLSKFLSRRVERLAPVVGRWDPWAGLPVA